jgi:hypothetical protein
MERPAPPVAVKVEYSDTNGPAVKPAPATHKPRVKQKKARKRSPPPSDEQRHAKQSRGAGGGGGGGGSDGGQGTRSRQPTCLLCRTKGVPPGPARQHRIPDCPLAAGIPKVAGAPPPASEADAAAVPPAAVRAKPYISSVGTNALAVLPVQLKRCLPSHLPRGVAHARVVHPVARGFG